MTFTPIVVLLSALFSVSFASASLLLPDVVSQKNYQPGIKLCDPKSGEVQDEHGFFISVPKDYQNPQKGRTSLYVHSENRFRPDQPSVIVFDGGPGLSSHSRLVNELPGWNILRFDQRGIACSRPDSYQVYRDVGFYSSENTARDAEAIRQKLQITSWAVYAHSYGTVPATIYASKYPEATLSLTLEGVVFEGSEKLWAGPGRRQLLQNVLAKLPSDTRAQVNSFALENQLPDYWFSALGHAQMMRNHGLAAFAKILVDLPSQKDILVGDFKAALQVRTGAISRESIFNQEDSMVFATIACRELSLSSPKAAVFDSLKNGVLVAFDEVPTVASEVCSPLGISYDEARVYHSVNYPVRKPVAYFQGADDGEVDSAFALDHFNKVRQGTGQLLILREGGHAPNQDIMAEAGPQQALQKSLFLKALSGQGLEHTQIDQFNNAGNEHWSFAKRL